MTFELITYGGGETLIMVFNAIVRIIGNNNFLVSLKISIIFGMFSTLLDIAFNGGFTKSLRFYISVILIYNIFLLPKVSLKITDRINNNILQNQIIDNVPFGLALVSSTISAIGDNITRLTEQAFPIPEDLTYSKFGLLFGSTLITNINSITIQDIRLSMNLNSFYRQCLMFNVLANKYSINDLAKQTDLWDFITSNTGEILSFGYKPESGEDVIYSCKEGSNVLKTDIEREKSNKLNTIHKLFFGKNTPINNSNDIISDTYSYMLGISQDSAKIIEQNLILNSIINFTSNVIGDTNSISAGQNYAIIKEDLQTKMSAGISQKQASKWLPILKIIIEALVYAMFPFTILIALFSQRNAIAILKYYFLLLISFQLWAPLYAILHSILILNMSSSGKAITDITAKGITLSNFIAIQNLSDKIAMQCGKLIYSIPFLSFAIVKASESGVANMLNSTIGSLQQTTASTSSEVASGNLSYGNSSFNNANYDNIYSHKHNTDFFKSSGKQTDVDNTGFTTTLMSDGTRIYNTSGMEHKLHHNINSVDVLRTMTQNSLNESKAKAENYGKAFTDRESIANNMVISSIKNDNFRINDSTSMSTSERESLSNSLRRMRSNSTELRAGIEVEYGGGPFQKISSLATGLDVKATASASASQNNTSQYAKDLQTIQEAIKSGNLTITDDKGNSLNETISTNLTQAQDYAKMYREEMSKVKNYQESISNMTSNEMTIRQNLDKKFVDNLERKYDQNQVETILKDNDLTNQEMQTFLTESRNNDIQLTTINFNQGAMSNLTNQPDFIKEYENNKHIFNRKNYYDKEKINQHNTNPLQNLDLEQVRENNLEKMDHKEINFRPFASTRRIFKENVKDDNSAN